MKVRQLTGMALLFGGFITIGAAVVAVSTSAIARGSSHFDSDAATLLEAAGASMPPAAHFYMAHHGSNGDTGATMFSGSIGPDDDHLVALEARQDRSGQAVELGIASMTAQPWMKSRRVAYVAALVNAVESDLEPAAAARFASPIATVLAQHQSGSFLTPHARVSVKPWGSGFEMVLTPR